MSGEKVYAIKLIADDKEPLFLNRKGDGVVLGNRPEFWRIESNNKGYKITHDQSSMELGLDNDKLYLTKSNGARFTLNNITI